MLEPLSPQDIEKADFAIAMRGYDREEVDGFLRAMAQEQRTLLEELTTAKRGAEQSYLALGDEIGGLLQHAKDVADDMVKKADEEAARLLDDARQAAERTTSESEQRAAEIRAEAQKDAAECVADATEKVSALQESERDARERLHSLRTLLQSLGNDIEQAEAKPLISKQPTGTPSARRDAEETPVSAASEPMEEPQVSAPATSKG